ncbi:hypothetical protein ACFQMF_05925 [Halorubrum rutilum]|uniref:Uncharacterized protein n=1 Tax=Halorubrum rutilum TaxID=1364933 RepID=A0ABD6AJI6_9EURY|nr:hypothetical protein [Halorubrum rutilum]
MSTTTVTAPDADETCAYCGSRIFEHDPICVRDCEADCGSPAYFFDILPALKREDSHGTAPLSWDIVVYDVTRS